MMRARKKSFEVPLKNNFFAFVLVRAVSLPLPHSLVSVPAVVMEAMGAFLLDQVLSSVLELVNPFFKHASLSLNWRLHFVFFLHLEMYRFQS